MTRAQRLAVLIAGRWATAEGAGAFFFAATLVPVRAACKGTRTAKRWPADKEAVGLILFQVSMLAALTLVTPAVSVWLWFTVLFANFAEALAEGRSKALR